MSGPVDRLQRQGCLQEPDVVVDRTMSAPRPRRFPPIHHRPLRHAGAACLAGGALLLSGGVATAENAQPTSPEEPPTEIVILGARPLPVSATGDATTGIQLTREAIESAAGVTHTSAIHALDPLASVHVESADGLGLGLEPNPLRVRGQLGDTYARFANTVERIPLGLNVARGMMGSPLDLENFAGMIFHRGPVPADRGFGHGNTAGALDATLLRPGSDPRLRLVLGGGLFDPLGDPRPALSLFARADSGELRHAPRFFLSGSYNHGRKWRGPGDTDRFNGTVGLVKTFGDRVVVELFGVLNHLRGNEYRALTYAQTQSPATFKDFDFTQDGTFLDYRYNRQDLTERAAIAEIHLRIGQRATILIEPYATSVDGVRWFGSEPNPKVNGVNRMVLRQRQYGLLAEARFPLAEDWEAVAGTWVVHLDTVPPPSDQKFYLVSPGQEPTFSRWNILARTGARATANPYLAVRGHWGRLAVDAGAKLIAARMPSVTGYDPASLPDVPANAAIALGPPTRPGLYADGQTQVAFLPHLGIKFAMSEAASIRAGYGRNYAYPFQGPLYSTYNANAENFGNLGMTLNDLWRGLRLETSDNVELGVLVQRPTFEVRPSLYYACFHNKQVLAYDAAVGVPYYRNIAAAEALGAELEVGGSPWTWLALWVAGSYNRATFTRDLATKSATPLATKGKQFADAPVWLGKIGATARYRELSVSPFLRFVGARYGDLMNTERIGAYGVVDVVFAYRFRQWGNGVDATLALRGQNILDTRYVGIISNQQDISEALSTTYYPGAPRFWMLSLDGTFGPAR